MEEDIDNAFERIVMSEERYAIVCLSLYRFSALICNVVITPHPPHEFHNR